ncbi:PIG-P [Cantharellus anzutake]|uniref:PIG-P n=1 Tax=Cantharellus anzutake TaxID=1750568 RepID=UPI001905D845|nr:PIG-P [Cantharellus anzutake]KAF8343087.1 PIG-P [Cantharellus anzutake]
MDTVEFAQESGGNVREIYGFVALVSTSILYVVYLIWAFIPDRYLVSAGIKWYPSREWSILVPSYTMVVVLLAYWSYFALAWSSTPSFDSLSTIVDEYSAAPPSESGINPYLRHALPDAVPEIYDIPIGMVNRVLYGPHPPSRAEEKSPS